MKELKLSIIPSQLLEQYNKQAGKELQIAFDNLHDSELSIDVFSFYTSVSAVFSSKIEGEQIELDSYIKHKRFGVKFLPDYTRKTDDLYNTYQFAKEAPLNRNNIEKAHAMLTRHILAEEQQGKMRTGNVYVTTPDGRIEYVAATPFEVPSELKKFYDDLEVLINTKLTINDVFFFAAMIHLVFVKIHPFNDGNGRTARLIEKWFLAQKLGIKAWFIQSEKNYYVQHQEYYKNIRALGLEYSLLEYSEALPFLLMLSDSLMIS